MSNIKKREKYDDYEILDDYDFSGGVRGRFYEPKKIPVSFSIFSCTNSINAKTSAALAWPVLTIKLACLGEIHAPPILFPFNPALSIKKPALSWGGFLKIHPAEGKNRG